MIGFGMVAEDDTEEKTDLAPEEDPQVQFFF